MIERDRTVEKAIDSILGTMKDCKVKLKNRALLRNLSDLNPVLNNKTRWSSTYHMISRFNKLRDALINMTDSEDSNFQLDHRITFKNKVERYEMQLKEIKSVTLDLNKRWLTLLDSRLDLDELTEAVSTCKNDPEYPFYKCRLGSHYIAPTADIFKSPNLESGVVKIQSKEAKSMTEEENMRAKLIWLLAVKIQHKPANSTIFRTYVNG